MIVAGASGQGLVYAIYLYGSKRQGDPVAEK